MRRKLLLALIAASLSLPVAASSDARREKRERKEAEELATSLKGLESGASRTCIRLNDVRSTDVIGNTILYRMNSRLTYRNQTRGSCSDSGRALVTRTFNGDLCRGDIVRSVDLLSGIEGGFCVLGDFVAYQRPKTD
jgi:hypothetical protein